MVLPFTLDHLAGLGPFSHLLLLGRPPDKPLPFQPDPTHTSRFSPQAKNLSQLLNLSPSGLPPKATRAFGHPDSARFERAATSSEPVFTATQWAMKTLALNTSLALATHLQRSMANAFLGLHDDLADDLTCKFTPYRSLPAEIHDPIPNFLQPTSDIA